MCFLIDSPLLPLSPPSSEGLAGSSAGSPPSGLLGFSPSGLVGSLAGGSSGLVGSLAGGSSGLVGSLAGGSSGLAGSLAGSSGLVGLPSSPLGGYSPLFFFPSSGSFSST